MHELGVVFKIIDDLEEVARERSEKDQHCNPLTWGSINGHTGILRRLLEMGKTKNGSFKRCGTEN